MRPSSLVAAIAACALVVAITARPARAQDCPHYCLDDTPNPGRCVSAPDAWCECFDSCEDSTTPQGPTRGGQAAIKVLGTIAIVVELFIVPGQTMRMLSGGLTPSKNREEFDALKQQLRADEALGRAIAGEASALQRAIDAAARAERERAAIRARVGWTPPRLVPSAQWQCDQARMLLPYREGWPVGDIVSWEQLNEQCGPPVMWAKATPVETCAPEELACGDACCPADRPVLNLCDRNCYASSDFFSAPDEAALRCASYRSCKVSTP